MTHITVTKGLDIPITGKPEGSPKPLIAAGHAGSSSPRLLALDLKAFDDVKFRLLVKEGDTVKIGQPLVETKDPEGILFASPAAGTVKEIRRGLKRALLAIIIDVANQESAVEFPKIDPTTASEETILSRLVEGGLFPYIRSRPFNLLADPKKSPRSIFVKALESAPFTPPAEMQISGLEQEFAAGLNALKKLTKGKVHLVYRKDSPCKAFSEASGVEKHTVEGPHPAANVSLHLQQIDPIRSADDVIWTLSARDVAAIGYLLTHGKYMTDRIVSIAGPGILPGNTGYFKLRNGYPVNSLVAGKIMKGPVRLVSGDPLMGKKVSDEEFLGFYDTAFTVIPENTKREFLHFMGLGLGKYSFSRAYMSGHLDPKKKDFSFTTSQHGEHRPFIDSTLYDKVMPLNVPTMLLVKAVMAEDFDLADTLGLIDVDSEDFALPTFVCPSKMEMTDIIKTGLKQYAKEVLQ